ncbi:MAG: hypothetical protein K0R34_3687 [Herbinix sp.]|jgi:hypothetical protein|nr:hypothetical protein [Herbinix sp.]
MIKLVRGRYGPKLLGPGSVLNLDEATEQRLVSRKVAVFIGEDDAEDHKEDTGPIIKTAEQVKKIKSKKGLVKYAESIGLHTLNEGMSMESLIDEIMNYQEEQFSEV